MDAVVHPKHYNNHESGVEAIELCRYLSFNMGNALKYLWRADHKGKGQEDRRKAGWYLMDILNAPMKDPLIANMPGFVRQRLLLVLASEPEGTPLARLLSILASYPSHDINVTIELGVLARDLNP